MPATDEIVNGMARLEAALDRIGRAARPAGAAPSAPDEALKRRLDILIDQIRSELSSSD